MAIVDFGPYTAEVLDGKWACENKDLEELLNNLSYEREIRYIPGNMDNELAQRAAESLAGEVLHLEPEYDNFEPEALY